MAMELLKDSKKVDHKTDLWPNKLDKFFPDKVVHHLTQRVYEDHKEKQKKHPDRVGDRAIYCESSCVPTCLAMLVKMDGRNMPIKPLDKADITPEMILANELRQQINTQDPVTWSKALHRWDMKLAYLPTDVRPLGLYLDELIEYDDLFMLAFYTSRTDAEILVKYEVGEDRHQTGQSHVVLLYKDQIHDPSRIKVESAKDYDRLKLNAPVILHTKRLFRVVPLTHERGL
jgi:hypothetical protein